MFIVYVLRNRTSIRIIVIIIITHRSRVIVSDPDHKLYGNVSRLKVTNSVTIIHFLPYCFVIPDARVFINKTVKIINYTVRDPTRFTPFIQQTRRTESVRPSRKFALPRRHPLPALKFTY